MVALNITWKYFAVSWLDTSSQMVINSSVQLKESKKSLENENLAVKPEIRCQKRLSQWL